MNLKDRDKTRTVACRLTEEEYKKFLEIKKKTGQSTSEALRTAINLFNNTLKS